jgi:hypothetical protein
MNGKLLFAGNDTGNDRSLKGQTEHLERLPLAVSAIAACPCFLSLFPREAASPKNTGWV